MVSWTSTCNQWTDEPDHRLDYYRERYISDRTELRVGDEVEHIHNGTKYTVGTKPRWKKCTRGKTWVKRSGDHVGYGVITANLRKVENSKIKVGDIVKKGHNGTHKFIVQHIEGIYVRLKRVDKDTEHVYRYLNRTGNNNKELVIIGHKEEETMAKETLYQVVGKEEFGTYLATNRDGEIVLDMKGGGVKAFKKDKIEEVMPYTVAVKFVTGSNQTQEYHYYSDEGKVKVGDLVLIDSSSGYAEVVELDTKSKSANKDLSGWVISQHKL